MLLWLSSRTAHLVWFVYLKRTAVNSKILFDLFPVIKRSYTTRKEREETFKNRDLNFSQELHHGSNKCNLWYEGWSQPLRQHPHHYYPRRWRGRRRQQQFLRLWVKFCILNYCDNGPTNSVSSIVRCHIF